MEKETLLIIMGTKPRKQIKKNNDKIFDKYIVLYADKREISPTLSEKTKIAQLIKVNGMFNEGNTEIISIIDQIITNYHHEYELYFFGIGEDSTRFFIYLYNKIHDTNIDYNIFRNKKIMNEFLGKDLTGKKNYLLKNILNIRLKK